MMLRPRPFLFTFCALAVAVIIAGCGKREGKAGTGRPGAARASEKRVPTVSVVTAKTGSIADEIQLTGTCEAYDESDVVPEVSGKVAKVAVDIGDSVENGDLLVQLDTSLASKQTRQAAEQVSSARARLQQAEEGAALTNEQTKSEVRRARHGVSAAREKLQRAKSRYQLTKDQVENAIDQAKVGLATAQAAKRDVFAGSRTQEIAQAEAAVRQAESEVALKKSNYNRYRRLYEQGAVAEATLEQHKTQYEVAKQNLQKARQSLSLARAGARQEQRRQAELKVQQAQKKLRLAKARRKEIQIDERNVESAKVALEQAKEALELAKAGRRQHDVRQAEVAAARASIESADAARDLATTRESKYTITAPIAGQIASRNVDVGEGATPTMPIMRIVNLDPIRVNCNVSELNIADIEVGDSGVATIDGLGNREFYGKVVDISPQAKAGQRTYTARVQIDNHDGLIKPGMFARVNLILAEMSDVVVTCRDCLVERGQRREAYVVVDGKIQVREVQTGITNAENIEIVSGLKPGDTVVYGGQAMLADGQQVKPVPADRQKQDQMKTENNTAKQKAQQADEKTSGPSAAAASKAGKSS